MSYTRENENLHYRIPPILRTMTQRDWIVDTVLDVTAALADRPGTMAAWDQ